MQKWFSFIPVLIVLSVTLAVANSNSPQELLRQADSLYQKKKFAESRELYFQLYQLGQASQATILKMAFVHEGLGEIGYALFFLTTYYNQTEDSKAYEKILKLAKEQNLTGFELSDFDRATIWLNNRLVLWLQVVIAGCVLCLAALVFAKSKGHKTLLVFSGGMMAVLICLLLLTVNFSSPLTKAVITKQTYFMSGPSAASNFLGMVPEGNQVSLIGMEDVWVKIKWNEKEGYMKRNDLLF
jgi:hypothetical protein